MTRLEEVRMVSSCGIREIHSMPVQSIKERREYSKENGNPLQSYLLHITPKLQVNRTDARTHRITFEDTHPRGYPQRQRREHPPAESSIFSTPGLSQRAPSQRL